MPRYIASLVCQDPSLENLLKRINSRWYLTTLRKSPWHTFEIRLLARITKALPVVGTVEVVAGMLSGHIIDWYAYYGTTVSLITPRRFYGACTACKSQTQFSLLTSASSQSPLPRILA